MSPAVRPIPLAQVRLTGGLLAERQRIAREVSLADQYEKLKSTGRLRGLELEWTAEDVRRYGEPRPHVFWESDIAKWLEAVGFALELREDAELRRMGQHVVGLLIGAQQGDGYLNVHYTLSEPGKRFTNLRDKHELYCAGHLIEAAIAWRRGSGDDSLLSAMRRYADLIVQTFGGGPGEIRGYCGHQEIELALAKLAGETRDRRYLETAAFFVEERGRDGQAGATASSTAEAVAQGNAHFFVAEAAARGEGPLPAHGHARDFSYWQAHTPVREQTVPEGHAVRAMYMYCGAVDVAVATGDEALLATCRQAFDHMLARRTYIHGGIGSVAVGEAFSFDYDLPNESAYAETCAAIGLILFAQRLLEIEPDARYADAIERSLYNNVLAGLSLDGRRYFYENLLEVRPPYHEHARRRPPVRQEWFGCACCPPNVSRLLMSIGRYFYGISRTPDGAETLYVHQYAAGEVTADLAGAGVGLSIETDYPHDGRVTFRFTRVTASPKRATASRKRATASPEGEAVLNTNPSPSPSTQFTLALRLPAWCDRPTIRINGEAINPQIRQGYAHLRRRWQPGDEIVLDLPMPPRRLWADPRVRQDAGRVAIMRGPLLYCLEEADNGPDLSALRLGPADPLEVVEAQDLAGVPVIEAAGQRLIPRDGPLYRPVPAAAEPARLRFIPYWLWANREAGEMLVWVPEGSLA